MDEIWAKAGAVAAVRTIFDPHAPVYVALAVLLLVLARFLYERSLRLSVRAEVFEQKNAAVGLSFAGYLLAVGVIYWSLLGGDYAYPETGRQSVDLLYDLGSTALWSAVGILLLQVATRVNDRWLLHQFDNRKELVDDRNLGTGAVEAGAYVGAALMIRVPLSGDDGPWGPTIVETVVYFVAAQGAFLLFAWLYERITRYRLHDAIERDNAAAGTAFGLGLVAVGHLLSSYLLTEDSLFGFGIWLVLGFGSLVVGRLLVDWLLFPGVRLDRLIGEEQNLGAALVEGAVSVVVALLLGAALR